MLLVVKQGREAEVERDLREVGPARRAHRRGHRRRPDAREGPRRGRRRDSEPRADRRGAGLPPADAPSRRTCARRSTLSLADARRRRRRRRGVPAAARVADDRQQALGLPAVRPHGAHQHARAARAWAPASCASRARSARWRCRSTATAGSSTSIRIVGAQLAVAEAARNVACAGGAADRRDQLPQLRQPAAARDHVAVRRGGRGHGRGLPRARHPDHRRQRQPLQRDRRPRRAADAGASAWSG